MRVVSIVGARPNFMKVAPLHRAFSQHHQIISRIVHTGQHYDAKMSDIFFEQLGLPTPDYYLGVGGGTHTEQTARTMLALEPVLTAEKPDWLLVVGDVNATIASSLVAVKMGIKVAHVEAGLRSRDRSMPEELNRVLTDSISDLHFVTEQAGVDNLLQEGVAASRIHFVGNCMIDTLVYVRQKAKALQASQSFNLQKGKFILMTMHRPANVDSIEGLKQILSIIRYASQKATVVFPVHPRTRKNFEQFDLLAELEALKNVILTEPLGYLEFLSLMEEALMVITDSGGIQEETTYLQVPCLTYRTTTERPCTTEIGSNVLLSDLSLSATATHIDAIVSGNAKRGVLPPLWDGRAAERIAEVFLGMSTK